MDLSSKWDLEYHSLSSSPTPIAQSSCCTIWYLWNRMQRNNALRATISVKEITGHSVLQISFIHIKLDRCKIDRCKIRIEFYWQQACIKSVTCLKVHSLMEFSPVKTDLFDFSFGLNGCISFIDIDVLTCII